MFLVQKAYKFFDRQYKAAVEHDAKGSIRNALGNTANITNISGKHEEALKIFIELISVCEDLNDKDGLSKTYNNIGLCNKLLHRYDDAMTNYKQSLEISKQKQKFEFENWDKKNDKNRIDQKCSLSQNRKNRFFLEKSVFG